MEKRIERHEISKFIIERISKLADIPKREISIHKPFNLLGLSSLDGIQLVDDLNKKLATSYSPTILFDYPTIHKLINYLLDPAATEQTIESKKISNINEPIAIVGMACHFPQAPNLNEFWKLLDEGKDAITEVPDGRWKDAPADLKAWGGFIERPNAFDNKIFDIYENESKYLDPQQRKVLETAWLAIEHSGYSPQDVMGTNTGVYIGISTNDYSLAKVSDSSSVDVYDGIGGAHSIAANRVSYFFNFHGPSWAVDTACSSSLVSISQAVGHLRSGECDMALAGGVNILYTSHLTQSFNKAGMLSPDGRCKTFSDKANGYVRGEGVGILVLKRLKDAKRDNDKIWGVVKGFAYNQDGRSNGLTAPNGKAQESVIKKALRYSNLEAKDIDYIEAHGTGTPLGDPIEYSALKNCFNKRENDLYIGSVKTNIGHLEAAAGVASVIKVLLAMENSKIPKVLHFEKMNSKMDTRDSKLQVVKEARPWHGVKRAGVSSFGFGGTNAHIILEKNYETAEALSSFDIYTPAPYGLLMVSSSTAETLEQTLIRTKEKLQGLSDDQFLSYCYHQNKKVSVLSFREVIVAESRNEAIEKIDLLLNKKSNKKQSYEGARCFAFTGQGSQFASMGQELCQHVSLFREEYLNVKKMFEHRHHVDFVTVNNDIYQTQYAQVALFCIEYALFKVLSRMGINADYYVGHSLGEIVAYTCAGGMSLEDAVDLVFHRGQVMQKSPAGGMLVCFQKRDIVESFLKENNILLSIAAINAQDIIVLSGKSEEVVKCEELMQAKELKCKKLEVKQGFHSYLMDEILEEFAKKIEHIKFNETITPVISSVTGEVLSEVNIDYWVKQIREKTDFYGACKKLEDLDVKNIIEIGPHPTLTHLCRANIADLGFSLNTVNFKKGEFVSFLQFTGECFLKGLHIGTKTIFNRKNYDWVDTALTYLQEKEFSFGHTETTKIVVLAELNPEEVLADVVRIVAEQLDIDKDQIDVEMAIMNFGADSLLLLNVLDSIRDIYGVTIAITDVFQDLSNIKLISEFIVNNAKSEEGVEVESRDTSSVEEVNNELHEKSRGVLGNFAGGASKVKFSAGVDEEVINKLIKDFIQKTGKSKDWSEKYRKFLADNRVSAGFRPNLKEMVYPIIWEKADGAYFWDLDGNKYIDYTMGFGVNLFGHSPEFINKEIKEQLGQGMALGPQSHMAAIVAKEFCELTGNERIAFLNSGTEAVMTCIRLARAKTGREKIVIFEGSYHGHFDGVLGRSNALNKTVPVAPGVPSSLIDGLIVLDYGAQASLDFIKEHADELAAVIVEPVQSRYPENQPREFLQAIREITEQSETAFVFDEVITGLRVAKRGAQEFFGVKADLASYGKVLGGGMPIGAVAGKKEYLDFIDGGEWHFGDQSMPMNPMTFFAGTFCKHSLAMASSYATIMEIKKRGDEIFTNLNNKTQRLADELNSYFEELKISLRIVHFSSLFRFKFTGNMDLLFYFLNLKGIYIWEGRNLFLSTAHSEQDINDLIRITKETVKELVDINYIKTGKKGVEIKTESGIETTQKEVVTRKMTDEHFRFKKMSQKSKMGQLASKITVGIEVTGEYQADQIKSAIEQIVNRHESLLSTYDLEAGEIHFNRLEKVDVALLDFTSLDNSEEVALNWLEDSSGQAFDLRNNCVDINLLLISKTKAIIAFSAHHIALDGLSLAMLSFDIAHAYSYLIGEKKKLDLKEVSFIEFLDTKELSEEKLKNQLNYWKEQYSHLPTKIFSEADFKGGRIAHDLTAEESKKLKFYGYRNKSSLMNTLLLSLLKLLKKKYGRDEFVVGIPMAGHKNITDSMVGNCVNLLPFRLKLPESIEDKDMIAQIKEYQLESFKYSELPYERIKDEIGEDLIEVVLNVEPINELPKFGHLKADLITYPSKASEYPIYINAMKVEDIVNITIDYQDTALENKDGAGSFMQEYVEFIIKTIS